MSTTVFDEMDLPISNPNEDLETISRYRLLPHFDISRFEVRSEDFRDKGIDLHIELKKNNKYLNFRLVVQLKATESKTANRDGSISLQLDTSNINYLLNNPMPAYYILYIKGTDTFYYEKINDFAKLLSTKDSDWHRQESHTLRFSKKLNSSAVDEIYAETLQKGKFHRVVNEKLLRKSALLPDKDKILVDESLNVTDDSDIRRLIEEKGLFLINEGKWKELIQLHKEGSGALSTTGKYNLVLGIAYYSNGNLIDSLSHLKYAERYKAEFEPKLLTHLKYFLVSVKHALGICTTAEYNKSMDELEDAENVGLFIKIEKARSEYFFATARRQENQITLINSFHHSLLKIVNHPKADHAVRFYAESEMMWIIGSKINWDYATDICGINAAESRSGANIEIRIGAIIQFRGAHSQWVKNTRKIQSEILSYRNYFYYYNTVINEVRVFYEMAVIVEGMFFEIEMNDIVPPRIIDPQAYFSGLLGKLSKALMFYRQVDYIENIIVTLCLEYEILHYLGKTDKALTSLREAEHLIETYELNDKRRQLNYLENAGTVHERLKNMMEAAFDEAEQHKREFQEMVLEMEKMDNEDRKHNLPASRSFQIELFPIGYFQFPEDSLDKVYEILRVQDPMLKEHFGRLFTFVIPIANIFYSEVTEEGRRDGKSADTGIENWRNIYRVRKAFFDNKFWRLQTNHGEPANQ